jgi:hypothetical protein
MTRLNRRTFLQATASMAATSLLHNDRPAQADAASGVTLSGHRLTHPLAITMWDFSWLERRWPGAGYEDWDQALDELKERGYDAVRIDAYPHLVAADPGREWELLPLWNNQDWGSPARCRVRVQPELNEFIAKCGRRGMLVGLSTWYREDRDNLRMNIKTPEDLGRNWQATLDSISPELRRHILYVDLCNEFPTSARHFLPKGFKRATPEGHRWMRDSIDVVRKAHPELSYTFSFSSEYNSWQQQDVAFLDLLEPHVWMTSFSDFNKQVGYKFDRFDPSVFDAVVEKAEPLYRSKPEYWQSRLEYGIDLVTEWSRVSGKPLITTECWGIVDYKDWPLLHWDWVQDLCEWGVRRASSKGRWVAMATSNFCGPQFRGMWRDVAWHRRLTDVIHQGKIEI